MRTGSLTFATVFSREVSEVNKTLKRLLITLAVLAGICGLVVGSLFLFKKLRAKPVNVYSARDFAMTDYWGDSSQTYGEVRTDKIQTVSVSETQSVTEVFVREGDSVKVGDPLVAFDTTLSDIDLEKAENTLARLKQDLEDAEEEMVVLQNAVPFYTVLITPEPTGVEYYSETTPQLISGEGTEDDPLYVLWGADDSLTVDYLAGLFPEPGEAPEEEPEEAAEGEEGDKPAPRNWDEVYIAFVTRSYDALNAPIKNSFGIYLNRSSGSLVFKVVEPVLSEEIQQFEVEPEPYYQSYGTYSSAELAQMRSEQEKKIQDLELSIKLAEVDLRRLQDEVSDGVVVSKLDGVVKFVRDPEEALMNGLAMLEVSGGGGYYIEASLSEMELDTMKVGNTVTVNSWQSGMTYEGTVVEISEFPTNNTGWSNGNNNVSWYPFTIFVSEDAELTEYEYVDITYQPEQQNDGGWYLESVFVRSEGGKSFVFMKGEDGRLVKRTVQTGKDLWGSYKQIRGGLTPDDFVAFPYGNDVVDGAETVEAEASQLYESSGLYY